MKSKKFDILVLVLIGIICIGYTSKIFQNDTFYTIKLGELISKNGVDMIDHFSFHGLPYTYPHWLYDLLTYILYNIGGFKILYFTNIILYFVLCSSLYFLSKNISENHFASATLTVIATVCVSPFITARAQLVTYILFVYELYFIEKFLHTGSKKYLFAFPIISILIVNLHCAVWPFFFILLLPCIMEYFICKYRDSTFKFKKIIKSKGRYLFTKNKIELFNKKIEVEFNKNSKYLFLIFVICLFTGLITINGLTPYTYIIKTMMGNTTTWISEHQAPVLRYNYPQIFYLILTFICFSFLNVKIKLRDMFLIFGLIVLSVFSFRHLSLLILCITFPLSKIFSDFIFKKSHTFDLTLIKAFTKIGISSLLIVLITLLSFSNYYSKKIYNQEFVDKTSYPVDAANYILKNLDLKKIRLYNEYDYGSYLLYRNIPVFIDSRADLYTKQFNGLTRNITDDYLNEVLNYDEIFSYYNITHVIMYKYNSEFEINTFYKILKLDNNYSILYEDKYFAIFERNLNER